MIRKWLPELGALALLLLLPLLLYGSVALGSKTLVPADILFSFEPYRTAADEFGVAYPQNHLLGDLILQNYPWKQFLVESFQNRQLPLWDPTIFAGHPFLANGQHAALYPLSVLFYALPLWRAFGIFTWLQLGLAGMSAYLFSRVLGIRRLGSLICGITFQLSGFMIVSVVHPMIIAGASWLPFILAMVELVIRQRPALGGRPASLPWALLGAAGLGSQLLAGHAENSYFVLLVTGLYAAWRLGGVALPVQDPREPQEGKHTGERRAEPLPQAWKRCLGRVGRPALWLTLMVGLGLALGAVQLIPLYEVASTSFRGGEEAATLQEVLSWAYPPRRLIAFAVPNFFGNPSHHTIFDVFSWRSMPAPQRGDGRYVYWGIKNHVEGGAYLGLLPLLLALLAVGPWLRRQVGRLWPALSFQSAACRTKAESEERSIPFFTLLSLFSLGCMFGTPLYAIVYALPLLKQSHAPFRWVFPLTISVAVLAGFGVERVQRNREADRRESGRGPAPKGEKHLRPQGWRDRLRTVFLLGASPTLVSLLASLAFWVGLLTLGGVTMSRALFTHIEPLVEGAYRSLAGAPSAFPNHRAFYSYEVMWIALFALLLTGSGVVLRLSRCPIRLWGQPVWGIAAVGLLALDLLSFGHGFHPTVDPALLDYTPPVVEFLRQRDPPWRYATFAPLGGGEPMKANAGMLHGLQCVAGYDSLFSDQYRDYMDLIEEQGQVAYNRIAPFRTWDSLDSPLTDLLNVKYIMTGVEIPSPRYVEVYRDEAVRIYENLGVMPRAFTLSTAATVVSSDFESAVQTFDPRHHVIVEGVEALRDVESPNGGPAKEGTPTPHTVTHATINDVIVDVEISEPSWLVLADSYAPGWKAFVRPQGGAEAGEQEVAVHRVNGTFRGVRLEEPGTWTLRFKYSPDTVKLGAFSSFVAGMALLFLVGLYLWRFFYREADDADTVQRVAKNSAAPIVLNFFNRIIDFAFAALMARILGPIGMGRYFTAVNIYLWFDTLANFGLDMYLIREVARRRDRARRVFVNATLLRLLLFVAVAPLLAAFLAGRQALHNPLTGETIAALVLLYAGLLPGTLANSLTALFRGFERHEVPAAIQTVTTIIRVTLGTLTLAGGLGIVGLAGASILTNAATLVILGILAWRLIWRELPPVAIRPEPGLLSTQAHMLAASWPLMGSLLLQSLFTGANVVLLQYFQGDGAVGWYDAASKWVMNMLNIIPSLFTFAVFPVLSRQAAENRERLRRSYQISAKLLTIVALPMAVCITLLATPMVWLLSGQQYLPHGAIALRILIWSILLGWINSLTNYVLIALDRQRFVVWASAARVVFAVAANIILVPRFSYVASAWIIIAGELVLYVLFAVDLHRHLKTVAWGAILGRPAAAGLAMGATAWLLVGHDRAMALSLSLAIYIISLILVRALTAEERRRLASLLPAPFRRAVDRFTAQMHHVDSPKG